ncbi:MAG: LamG domain-containing protein [Bacteroidales bacterium]|nr:LamG domain-containing protein [Bacteroidales bacterium]
MKKFNYLFWTFLIVLFSLSVSAQNYALSFYPGTGSGINKNTFTVYGIDVSSNTKLTVEAWCNLESLLPGNMNIVIKENTDCMSSADIAYWMYINSTGYLVFHLGNGTSFTQVTTTNPIPLDEWHHLSGTWDGSTIRVYIDGIEEATGSLSGSLDVVNDAGEMNIGNRWYCYRQPYDGIIDELRIWDVDWTICTGNFLTHP